MQLQRLGIAAMLALPGALTAWLAFHDGGFFPAKAGVVTVFVCLAVVVRVTSAARPLDGIGGPFAVAAGALSLLALWTLASRGWSDAPARSNVEFTRTLLYLAALVLFGSLPASDTRLRWMVRGLWVAFSAICLIALITRVLPEVWPTSATFGNDRLSYPVTYWNTLGLIGALAVLLSLHVSASRGEPRWLRAVAAGLVPLLALTVYFTFSRAAILVGILGIAVFAALLRTRGVVATLAAVALPAAGAVLAGVGAETLATTHPADAAGVAEGRTVALIGLGCALAAALLRVLCVPWERRARRSEPNPAARRRFRLAVAGVAVLAIGAAVAAGAPGRVSERFQAAPSSSEGDQRTRLLDPSGNGRTAQWRAAFDAFGDAPLRGEGAGTYQLAWERFRPTDVYVKDAHALYFETLGELGVVGLVLLLVALGAIGWGAVAALRRRRHSLHAVLAAALLVWAVRAGVDWDWEMPVATLWVFCLGGALMARPHDPEAGERPAWPGDTARTAVAVAFLVAAALPALVAISDARVRRAQGAVLGGRCPAALSDAFGALKMVAQDPRAFEIIGYCDLRNGFPRAALKAFRTARGYDPENWQYDFDAAIAEARIGTDPRASLAAARRKNPREQLLRTFAEGVRSPTPGKLRKASTRAEAAMLQDGRVAKY
ncbi:MAG TPA: O-antigen ligase family protein [Solirubrobacteraceae bacterium]